LSGAAVSDTLVVALQRAMEGDPVSAFGSVLGLNRTVDAATAEALSAPGLFVEAIVAPHFHDDAMQILTSKPKWKSNVRLMEVGQLDRSQPHLTFRYLDGGMLLQEADVAADPEGSWQVVTEAKPSEKQMSDLRFAWEMVRHVKSNAIVLCKDRMLLGAGAGQMSRVDSVEIAVKKAGDRAKGSVMGSDAFFPFPDSIDTAAAVGVVAVIQPGGSKNDEAAVAACNRHGIAMVVTGRRHFKH
jgi:phosphoribosylaminoimidazolecarboxamide formyltransferase/IMP cyclohydrolase